MHVRVHFLPASQWCGYHLDSCRACVTHLVPPGADGGVLGRERVQQIRQRIKAAHQGGLAQPGDARRLQLGLRVRPTPACGRSC